jgi:hypothetical protein
LLSRTQKAVVKTGAFCKLQRKSMKKILTIVLISCVFACSSSGDDKKEECTNKLWNLTHDGTQYYASYGPTAAEATSVEVDEDTYNYYSGLGTATNGSICWKGTHD